jgi:acetyl-CoA acetyltransferase family protein
MGNTAENIAKEFNISRADQDSFAKNSHRKALEAIKNGLFKNEIVSVPVGDKSFDTDECPTEISLTEYESYPSVFMKEGTVTKGNACGLNDGASTVLVADKEQAVSLGLDIQAEVIGTAMTGNDPNTMGLGPVYAIQKLLKKISMKIEDIDYFELNEAFAAQSLACVRQLNIPEEKVNVHGGSIALGHPIGCSGSRILATLINVLKEKNAKTGIASLCIGGGMGIAIAIKLQ